MKNQGRRKKRTLRHYQPKLNAERGFDLAEQLQVLAVSDFGFNQALRDAGVFACAYGYHDISGFPGPIPGLTLVGENSRAFESAFGQFASWGCEQDGDAVEIHMMLKIDGTYEMWIGPEIQRTMYRILPQAELCSPLLVNYYWIKPFDSTSPSLRALRKYCKNVISPVFITAGISNPKQPNLQQTQPIPGLPKLIKFELHIVDEGEDPSDPRFQVPKGGRQPDLSPPGREPLSPEEYCRTRRRTIDLAFPVSRERLRRTEILKRVRELPGFASVSETQVIQAAINLTLSAELLAGDRHYSRIVADLPEKLWDHVYSRYETINDGRKMLEHEPQVVARQVELDVRHVLAQRGVPTAGEKFAKLQAFFKRRGFIDD